MNLGLIIALIEALSKTNALQYGSTGISYIESTPSGNGLRFYFEGSGNTLDIPISNLEFMFKSAYDTTKTGNSVNKAQTLKNNTDNTWKDASYLLDRKNHTSVQLANTVEVKNTGYTDFLSEYSGSTLTDLISYLNTHKEFLNGLFIGDSTKEGSFRIQNIDSKLYIQRLENSVWITKHEVGSPNVENIVLTEDYSSIVYKSQDDTQYSVINQGAINDKTLRFSDPRLEKTFICGDSIEQIKYVNNTLYDIVVQTDTIETSNTNIISFDFTTPVLTSELLLAVEQMRINNTSPIESASITISEKNTGREIYKTNNDFEVKQGLGDVISTTGEQNIKLDKPVYLIANRTYTYTIKSKSPIRMLGKTVNGSFVPFAIFKYKRCAYLPFITKDKVSDSITLNSSDYVASSKAVNDVRKMISSAVSGVVPMGFITCADFNALTDGNTGELYFMSDNGIIGTTSVVSQGSWVMISNDFTGRLVTDSDFSYSVSDTKAKAPIFIINVEPMTYGKNVSIIRKPIPDTDTVASVITDDSNALKVTIEWDRNSDYYQGVPEVNGVGITSATKNGDTYTGSCIITDFTNNITANLGNGSYIVPLIIENPPIISSATFSTIYPTTNGVLQTELKENDLMPITITADKSFSKVEVYDYLAGKNTIIDVAEGISATINVTIANRGNTPQSLQCKIRVCSTNGFWSESHISDNTVMLNNTQPTISFGTITYPINQLALKETESATINYILTDVDINTPSIIGNDLSLGTLTDTSLIVTRLNTGTTTYNDNANNVSFVINKNSNGATATVDCCIPIVTISAQLSSQSLAIYNVSSGVGTVTNTLTFSQKVKVKSISALGLNKGTLGTGVTTTYNTLYDLGISAQDSDIHSNTINTTNLVVTNLSGLDSILIPVDYYIRGFANKVMTFVYPSLSKSIGASVVDTSKLLINGYILTSPLFEVCKIYEINPANINNDTADYYAINNSDLLLPEAVKQFGYTTGTNIQVNISEIY